MLCFFGMSSKWLGAQILAAVTPESQSTRALAVLQGLLGVFPEVVKSPNNLGISLRNPGQAGDSKHGEHCTEETNAGLVERVPSPIIHVWVHPRFNPLMSLTRKVQHRGRACLVPLCR